MATLDVDMTLPIDEITEPIIVTMSIEETRQVMRTKEVPDDVYADIVQFIEEYDSGAY